ncbi:MAG TPA: succinate dehydrogenase, cytochrome b556 subunit [Burkholderiaceae bacterium]|nr:succinate dehydrogenase, cytochrome b556 subunit [Burkholderiaceae bacterium]
MADEHKPRPVYTNIHVSQIVAYRLPIAGLVSILHRVSGALMFLLLPLVVWLLDVSLTSEVSYERFSNAFIAGVGVVPAFLLKLVVLALIWAFLHHLVAGVRHLWMDITHSVSLQQGHLSALATLGASLLLTILLGAKLFGLY